MNLVHQSLSHTLNCKQMEALKASTEKRQKEVNRLNDIVLDLSTRLQEQSADGQDDEKLMHLQQQMALLNRRQATDNGERLKQEDKLQSRIKSLGIENERLRNELSSFDLEFFEQLEDLKYNYSAAKRKLDAQ